MVWASEIFNFQGGPYILLGATFVVETKISWSWSNSGKPGIQHTNYAWWKQLSYHKDYWLLSKPRWRCSNISKHGRYTFINWKEDGRSNWKYGQVKLFCKWSEKLLWNIRWCWPTSVLSLAIKGLETLRLKNVLEKKSKGLF